MLSRSSHVCRHGWRAQRVPVEHAARFACSLSAVRGARGTRWTVFSTSTQYRSHSNAAGETQLGRYLKLSGATWGDAIDFNKVQNSGTGTSTWLVELPPERLNGLRKGDVLESSPFSIGSSRARIQFYPKGDQNSQGGCSLWLLSDKGLGPVRMSLGNVHRDGGSSEFCTLEDVLQDGKVEVKVQCGEAVAEKQMRAAPQKMTEVQQSLQMTGLQLAEWRLYDIAQLSGKMLITSPPFRFHHVLLGDMYLELQMGVPHEGFCTIFFRCRVPTMKLRVGITAGDAFSTSFIARGRSTMTEDLSNNECLKVNLDAPGVHDGDLVIRCLLEEVVSIPSALQHMIPRLNERASWPKRL